MEERLQKKETCDREQQFADLLSQVTEAYEQADSLRMLAEELHMTPMKLRKLLITAGIFTSEICEEVNRLHEQGKEIPEIMERTGLSRASVHSYLPYCRGIYCAKTLSTDAEKCRLYRVRQEKLKVLHQEPTEENFWNAIMVFQNYQFKTATGLPFRYQLRKGKNDHWNKELLIDRREQSKSLTWSSVLLAFQRAREKQAEIKKPKKLGDIRGVSYSYAILWRFGMIEVPERIAEKMRR